MANILFPVEAFDDMATTVVANPINNTVSEKDHGIVKFCFRADLVEICKSLEIPFEFSVFLRIGLLSKRLSDHFTKIKNLEDHARTCLANHLGYRLDEWGKMLRDDSKMGMLQKKLFLENILGAPYGSLTVHNNKAFYALDLIDFPDHLLEKYLMVKLAV